MYTNNIQPRVWNGLMEELFNHSGVKSLVEETLPQRGQYAPVNILETDTAYELHLMAPGLSKELFKVNVEKNTLAISFEQKEEAATATKDKWLRKEYKQRSFKRTFTLNDKIDATQITAKYLDGILKLNLPKKEQSEPQSNEIAVA